ncbi:metallophosphoesterase [Stenotrophomonas sp.]|uniref:metallophosphoesterase family protein n=1 Tax=Stenotrophomonas sp. TaxID=69392 RepID=UPI0028AEE162|nr:metallophosphoesterase [Stenotrophomonas sp.]
MDQLSGGVMATDVKIVVISDLHYRKHANNEVRPAAAARGAVGYDPVAAFVDALRRDDVRADYVICPGDITDRASPEGLKLGWEKLNEIKEVVGARHLIAATGNHEVCSRDDNPSHDAAGNAEASVDPLGMLQALSDYPSSHWNGVERKWIYWGKGYEFISDGSVLFLLVNSSHFHPTMRMNEFERGRISDYALKLLSDEIDQKIEESGAKIFIALLHHPPVSHESLTHSLGRIEMFNGSRLVEVLENSGFPWLILHGHKHAGRLIMAQGAGNQPIVFAAGSIGADLVGHQVGLHTKLQGYVLSLQVSDEALPALKGSVTAYAWVDNSWVPATATNHGIPTGCGFSSPGVNVNAMAESLRDKVAEQNADFLTLSEMQGVVPELRYLMPKQVDQFRRAVVRLGGAFTWPDNQFFPDDVSFEGGK